MSGMWNVHIIPFRDGEHKLEDGAQRWFAPEGGPVPDVDHNIMHRGEMFVVDRVIWDKERSSVTLHVVPVVEDEAGTETAIDETPDDGSAETGADESPDDGDDEDEEGG